MTYIWAHRGASAYAPENTLESFELACKMHAEGIELDVQLTKDGQLVVNHDETIDRTSDHKGFIKDYSLEQLKTFNFNNHMEGYKFCQIPTLKEVLELVKPYGISVNIELKTGVFEYPGIEKMVVELVKELGMQDKIIYSSFNHYSVLRVLEASPNAICGFLHVDKSIDLAKCAREHHVTYLHPAYYFLIQENYIKDAFINGLQINAWTINDPMHIKMALQAGINAIITNYPDVALKLRDEK